MRFNILVFIAKALMFYSSICLQLFGVIRAAYKQKKLSINSFS
ncbi:hypothetical protein M2133_000670 [Parabacteroides sp. PF5-6]|nr:hypothetical protein [Parabacteroides sp. PF5-6]